MPAEILSGLWHIGDGWQQEEKVMSKTSKIIFTVLESVIMALCYGLAAVSYFWELTGMAIFWTAVAIIMNIMVCSRTKRWEEPEDKDICWFD